jgi:hypothetical protein
VLAEKYQQLQVNMYLFARCSSTLTNTASIRQHTPDSTKSYSVSRADMGSAAA